MLVNSADLLDYGYGGGDYSTTAYGTQGGAGGGGFVANSQTSPSGKKVRSVKM